MSEVKFKIFCQNEQCKQFDEEINEITFDNMSEEQAMSFLESFGHGGEDEADCCPTCKELGVICEA